MPNCRVFQYSLCCFSCELHVNVNWCFTFFLVKNLFSTPRHPNPGRLKMRVFEIRDASNRWVWLGNSEPATWGVEKMQMHLFLWMDHAETRAKCKEYEDHGRVLGCYCCRFNRPIRFSNFSLRWEGRVQNEGLCLRRWKWSCHAIYTEREKTMVLDPLDW